MLSIHSWVANKSDVTLLGWPEPSVGNQDHQHNKVGIASTQCCIYSWETNESNVTLLEWPELSVRNQDHQHNKVEIASTQCCEKGVSILGEQINPT